MGEKSVRVITSLNMKFKCIDNTLTWKVSIRDMFLITRQLNEDINCKHYIGQNIEELFLNKQRWDYARSWVMRDLDKL